MDEGRRRGSGVNDVTRTSQPVRNQLSVHVKYGARGDDEEQDELKEMKKKLAMRRMLRKTSLQQLMTKMFGKFLKFEWEIFGPMMGFSVQSGKMEVIFDDEELIFNCGNFIISVKCSVLISFSFQIYLDF